ncbi:hypothetical protein A8990_111129 [Paenibacillus taihuensis]|uniref:Glycosyl transferase family 2 n=1 Tax=Paenibacillus taihuensis TaxID=1156355 RepID=A0A3D9S2X9_9BACL|nr:hypothetical protein [Paenibacillus taihuensis]REE86232.1 hypothetical protein A8990_111129 [Paenibacillus taihuensis]
MNSDTKYGTTSIIIPFFNGVHLLQEAISAIRQYTDKSLVREAGQTEPMYRLFGFCMLFKSSMFERIGELDSPGHYEDDDYSLRARMRGYNLLMCKDVFVHHKGSASFKRKDPKELQQLVERNWSLFISKWHVDPATFL